jgi:hypothetical protein
MRKLILATIVLACIIGAKPNYGSIILGDTGWQVDLLGDFDGEVFISRFPYDTPPVQLLQAEHPPIRIQLDKFFRGSVFDEFGTGQNKAVILFTEYSPTIIIDDELIQNLTNRTWTDFHMILSEGTGAYFDPDHIFSPGDGVNSFQTVAFGSDYKSLNFSNGSLLAGDAFWPGSDGSSIQINTNLAVGQSFILKEYPTIPEPAAIGLMMLGGMVMGRRRRRSVA